MPYYFYMCDMIPGSEHWRLTLAEGQALQHEIMGYLPGFATPRVVCDVPYVGKRWVHQVARYDTDHGISYWTKNYRTAIEPDDDLALGREYPYYDPIYKLPESGQAWWRSQRSRSNARRPGSAGWLVAARKLLQMLFDRGPLGRGDAEPRRIARAPVDGEAVARAGCPRTCPRSAGSHSATAGSARRCARTPTAPATPRRRG